MASYTASSRLRDDDSKISFPLYIPLVVEDIIFTVVISILGGAVLDGKNPMSVEYLNNPTPTN